MANSKEVMAKAFEGERQGAGQHGSLDVEKSGTGIVRSRAWVWLVLLLFALPASADDLSVTLLSEDGELLMLAEGEVLVLAGAGPGEQGYYLFEVHAFDIDPANPGDGDGCGGGTESEGSGSGGTDSEGSGSGGTDSEGSGSGGTDSEGSGSGGTDGLGACLWGLAEVLTGDDGLADLILYRETDGELEEFQLLIGIAL